MNLYRTVIGFLLSLVLGHFNKGIFRSRVAKIDSKILSGAKSLELCQWPDLFDSRHSLAVAQATVSSLRERLGQKEETLKRYEGLLKQARTDTEDTVRKLQVPFYPNIFYQYPLDPWLCTYFIGKKIRKSAGEVWLDWMTGCILFSEWDREFAEWLESSARGLRRTSRHFRTWSWSTHWRRTPLLLDGRQFQFQGHQGENRQDTWTRGWSIGTTGKAHKCCNRSYL